MTDNIDMAIAAVYGKVSYVQKERKTGLNYSFAGEAAIIEVIRPAMVENGITMRVLEIPEFRTDSFTSKSGTTMNQTTIRARIRFTHAPTGTYVDCEALGEGMDSGDKSASKAMTGAYKYAIRQTFMIETGDDPDSTPSSEQERASTRRTNGNKASLPSIEQPEWYGEFRRALTDAGLVVRALEPVIGESLTPETYMGAVARWLASDPAHSIGSLMTAALEAKATVGVA